MMGPSTKLGKSIEQWLVEYDVVFKYYGITTAEFRNVCWNLDCSCYDFYKEENDIEKLTAEDLFKIVKYNIGDLIMGIPQHAHLVATSVTKKYGNKWIKTKDTYINGSELCHNCHKAYDVNGGQYNNRENAQDYWTIKMKAILQSKYELGKFLNKKLKELNESK